MALLANASVSFRTNDENKDHDTNVTVEVRDNVGELVARVSNTFGPFDDQTTETCLFALTPKATTLRASTSAPNSTLRMARLSPRRPTGLN
jgi:hypothetical protein